MYKKLKHVLLCTPYHILLQHIICGYFHTITYTCLFGNKTSELYICSVSHVSVIFVLTENKSLFVYCCIFSL